MRCWRAHSEHDSELAHQQVGHGKKVTRAHGKISTTEAACMGQGGRLWGTTRSCGRHRCTRAEQTPPPAKEQESVEHGRCHASGRGFEVAYHGDRARLKAFLSSGLRLALRRRRWRDKHLCGKPRASLSMGWIHARLTHANSIHGTYLSWGVSHLSRDSFPILLLVA